MRAIMNQWKGLVMSLIVLSLFSTACQKDNFLTEEDHPTTLDAKPLDISNKINTDELLPNQRLIHYQFTEESQPVEMIVEIDEEGNLIAEGDIVIATADELDKTIESRGVAHSFSSRRWANATIPYRIEAGHPKRTQILEAIATVNKRTHLKVVARTSQSDYVEFIDGNSCRSSVGRKGGRQTITIGSCSVGTIMHEILHAAGLWHEQSRCDRDDHVTIHWDNITEGKEGNFSKHCWDGIDLGGYDYNSIMHYSEKGFSKNGLPTITTKNGADIGQRSGLSNGDVSAITSIYPFSSNSIYSGRFTGLFRKNTNDDFLWIGADWTHFNNKRSELAGRGYRLMDMETYVKNGKRRYDGVWEKASGGDAFYQYSSWSKFTDKWRELSGRGYRLIDIETFYSNGKRYYSGVFHRGSGKYALYQYSSWSKFTDKWKDLSNDGYRLIDIETFRSNNKQYYLGVYSHGTDAYALYNYNSWSSFTDKWRELGRRDIHLIDFERVKIGSTYKYLGVYRKKSNGTYLWHNVDWQNFKNKRSDLEEQGYYMVDYERH